MIVASKMKPRKLLLSVDLLPTISETHEDASQVGLPGHSTQSLEEYFASIKELAQPATSSVCTPLWEQRPLRPRLASFPPPKRRSPAPSPHIIPRACKPHLPVALDDITLTFATDTKSDCCSGTFSATRDPLDWLFAQTECEDLSLTENISPTLCLL